eukprot:jgi/Mesvir1/17511/Mv26490-RA.1
MVRARHGSVGFPPREHPVRGCGWRCLLFPQPCTGLTSWCWTLRGVAGICLLTFRWRGPSMALSHMAGASLTAGYTADRAERAKLLAYTATSGTIVWPCPLSWRSLGPWGP